MVTVKGREACWAKELVKQSRASGNHFNSGPIITEELRESPSDSLAGNFFQNQTNQTTMEKTPFLPLLSYPQTSSFLCQILNPANRRKLFLLLFVGWEGTFTSALGSIFIALALLEWALMSQVLFPHLRNQGKLFHSRWGNMGWSKINRHWGVHALGVGSVCIPLLSGRVLSF